MTAPTAVPPPVANQLLLGTGDDPAPWAALIAEADQPEASSASGETTATADQNHAGPGDGGAATESPSDIGGTLFPTTPERGKRGARVSKGTPVPGFRKNRDMPARPEDLGRLAMFMKPG